MDMFLKFGKNKMKVLKYYHDLYFKCFVLLQADVSEKFRNNSLKIYGLCSSHYLSAQGLSWDAMFKMTKIERDIIPQMSKFLPTSGFKSIDPKEFNLNKYTRNSSKGCVLEVDFEYPKELRELHYDHSSAPDKIEVKSEILSQYQLKTVILYISPIGNVKTLAINKIIRSLYIFC